MALAIENSKSIAQLAGNPLLLTMMAILNRHQELPRDRVRLYEKASDVLLYQWDTERGLEGYPELRGQVDLRAKVDILRSIAQHMQNGPDGLAGNIIDGKTLTDLIESYLRAVLQFDQSRGAAIALVEQLRARNFILCYLGADSYAFVHRTFLEYFCAADIVEQFHVARILDEEGLITLFDAYCHDDDWHEVLRLICGQINEQFVGSVIDHLSSRTSLDRWNGTTSLPELLLAIGCLSEARNLHRLEGPGGILAATLMKVFIPGKGPKSFHDQLLSSVQDIGSRWPGTTALWQNMRRQEQDVDQAKWAAIYLVRFLACVRPKRAEVEQLIASPNYGLRWGAVEALADNWPDELTRELLAQRAAEDESSGPRRAALEALADNWPDDTTRELLACRAVEDDVESIRCTALKALADMWPNETTRELLTERASRDDGDFARDTALKALADKWPDETTRDLLTQRASVDGSATLLLAEQHSEFGRVVLTQDLDRVEPYLDPSRPVSRVHIEEAAEQCGIPPEQIDAEVASLSEWLGWDLTKGSAAKTEA